jgi:hypothetical protein
MNALPLQFLLVLFAGWVNRYQCDVIEYFEEENRILGEQLAPKRLSVAYYRFSPEIGNHDSLNLKQLRHYPPLA